MDDTGEIIPSFHGHFLIPAVEVSDAEVGVVGGVLGIDDTFADDLAVGPVGVGCVSGVFPRAPVSFLCVRQRKDTKRKTLVQPFRHRGPLFDTLSYVWPSFGSDCDKIADKVAALWAGGGLVDWEHSVKFNSM